MKLRFDPAEQERFWDAIRRIPGYPVGDQIPLKTMLIESGALFRLPSVLDALSEKSQGEVLVVMDPTPMRRGSDSLKPLVLDVLRNAGWQPNTLVLEPDSSGQVHTDMPHIEWVKARIQAGSPVVSVGSGVVTDIAKHACYLYEQETGIAIPYVVYQTANSVSAYTSDMAPVFIEGVKRTLPSRYPDALISDLETLRDAPREMTVAGVGDLLAAFVSFPDWYLAHQLGMDPKYTELPHALMDGMEELFLSNAEEIRLRSLPGMALLAKLIHLAGLAMSLSHATTPLSGYEHVMSHILDLHNEQAGMPLAQHGSQVALTTILGSMAYEAFLDQFEPAEVVVERCFPNAERIRLHILNEFAKIDPSGKAGEECWSDYRVKLERWSEQGSSLEGILANWPQIKQRLQTLARPHETTLRILQAVEAPTNFEALIPPISESSAKFAFFNAPLMRYRFTLGDMLLFLNWDREALWERIWKSFSPPPSPPRPFSS